MPSLMEQIPDISEVSNLVTTAAGKLQGIAGQSGDFPFAGVQGIAGDLASVSLPDLVPVLDQIPTNLDDLISRITSDPSRLLGEIGSALQDIQGTLGDQFLAQIQPVLDQLSPLKDLIALEPLFAELITTAKPLLGQLTDFASFQSQDPAQLVSSLSGVLDALPSLEQLPYFGGLKRIQDTLKDWGSLSPERLGGWAGDTLSGLYDDLSALNGSLQAELDRLQATATVPAMEAIEAARQQAQAQLAALRGTDFSQGDHLAAATAAAQQLQAALNSYTTTLTDALNQVASGLQEFNPNTLLDRLFALFFAIQAVARLAQAENPADRLFDSLDRMLTWIDRADILDPLRETLDHLTGFLDQIDLNQIQGPILQAAEQITRAAGELERLQTEAVLAIKALFDEIRGAVEGIDVAAIQQAFQDLLQTFDQQLSPLKDTLAAFAQTVQDFINSLGESLDAVDLDALREQLQGALAQVQNLLQDPAVVSALDEVRTTLDTMMGQLEGITFAPVLDEVLQQIEDMRQKLSQIDVSSLNEILRMALKAALEIVTAIDFQGDIVGPLIGEFDEIVQIPQQLLSEVVDRYGQLLGKIETLQPSRLIGSALEEPVEAVKAGVSAIKPGQALLPIQDQLDAFLGRLEELAPSELLAPLSQFRDQAASLVQSASSLDIVAPLEEALGELRELVNSIDLDAWMADLQDYAGKASSLFEGFPLTGVLAGLSGVEGTLSGLITQLDADAVADKLLGIVDPILALFDQVDLGPIRTAADNLTSLLDQLQMDQVNQALENGLAALGALLDQLDVTDAVTTLGTDWRAVRDALAAVSLAPEFQAQYDALVVLVNATNPATLLTPAAASITDLRTRLAELQEQATSAVQPLAEPFAQVVGDFRGLFPDQLTAAFLKDTIREAISDSFLTPLKRVIGTVKDKAQVLAGLLETVESGIVKFKSVAGVLLNPLSMLEPIQAALNGLKEKLLAFDLSFLREEIQASAQAVADKIDELDLTELLAPLDTTYQAFLDNLRALLPTEQVATLDQLYTEKIGQVVEELDLEELLAPIDGLYQQVLEALEPFGIEALLQPVQDQMDALSDELTSGLQRTGQAFEQMLEAIPV